MSDAPTNVIHIDTVTCSTDAAFNTSAQHFSASTFTTRPLTQNAHHTSKYRRV